MFELHHHHDSIRTLLYNWYVKTDKRLFIFSYFFVTKKHLRIGTQGLKWFKIGVAIQKVFPVKSTHSLFIKASDSVYSHA